MAIGKEVSREEDNEAKVKRGVNQSQKVDLKARGDPAQEKL